MRAAVCGCLLCLSCVACRSNNILLGRVEAMIGDHKVVVTDCYRTSVPPPERSTDRETGVTTHHFVPCRDAEITIRDTVLIVNGKEYGPLRVADSVTVDHGKVLINDRDASRVASR
jgi:hypothetical protein